MNPFDQTRSIPSLRFCLIGPNGMITFLKFVLLLPLKFLQLDLSVQLYYPEPELPLPVLSTQLSLPIPTPQNLLTVALLVPLIITEAHL